jgi:peptidylprolyl isomerase
MMRYMLVMIAAFGLAGAAPQRSVWRLPDPENTLVVDTSQGRIVVELRPEFAPLGVARIKRLARDGVYDGLLFHRVIDGFVDQTGNPNNRDGGASSLPDLPPEFQFRLPTEAGVLVVDRSDAQERLLGATPYVAASQAEQARDPMHRQRGWGAYCAGVMGMGRQADPGSANSEVFFMREAARRLDHEYTVVGRAVVGLDVIRRVAVGEPPERPDRMVRVRVAADMPRKDRPDVEILDERSPAFGRLLLRLQRERGARFSICDVSLEVRQRK